MTSRQQEGLGDIDASSSGERAAGSPEHNTEAVRIVSNFPAGLRDNAHPVPSPQDNPYIYHDWLDDDDDDNDNEDSDELEEDTDELQQELDQDEWDEAFPGEAPQYPPGDTDEEEQIEAAAPVPGAFLGNPLHAMVAQAALLDPGIDLDELGLHELDPDDDVGLYDEEEDGLMDEEYMGDFIGDEDGDFVLPDEWDDQLGDLIHEDDYHANLHEFQFAVEAGQGQSPGSIPRFWGGIEDESDDDWDGADDEDDEQCQESFFSSTGHADPQWFCLSAASNHFQSADSLSTSGTPSCSTTTGSQDEEVVMLHNTFCLAVWRLPATPAAASSATPAAAASASQSAAAAESPSLDAAASSLLPSLQTTAGSGLNAPSAFSHHTQRGGKCASSTAVPREADAVLLAFTRPRFRAYSIARSPDGRFVAIGGHAGLVSLYELAVNPEHEGPDNSSIDQFSDPRLRAAALAAAHNRDGDDSIDAKCCPLVLQLVSHIALESQAGIVKTDSMANSVRFGSVGGRSRLLAACQNGCVYIFETGTGPLDSASEGLPCSSLQALQGHAPESHMRPVIFMSDSQLLDMHQAAMTHPDQDTDWGSFSSRATTAVLSDFPAACNCAVPSPDGQWIAVVGDAGCLHLLHASHGYLYDTSKPKKQKSAMLNFGAKRPRRTSQSRPRSNVSPGSQYCCWNSDSSLVAVSSDYYRAVMVFDVQKKQQLVRFEDHPCACLAVSFAPWDPQLLVFAEAKFRVYITDLRHVSHARQRLRVECNRQAEPEQHVMCDHIRGVSITPGGRLLIAHSDRLVQYDFLKSWSPQDHQSYPAKFKETAKCLLLAAAQSNSKSSPSRAGMELGLQSLPKEVLLKVLGLAATPTGQWMTGLSQASNTEGLPESALDLETLKLQQQMP